VLVAKVLVPCLDNLIKKVGQNDFVGIGYLPAWTDASMAMEATRPRMRDIWKECERDEE
jgi:hypothetical protein